MSTLLIVDDESWTRETIKALIDRDRLEISHIIEATNGEEAIESIKALLPDFVITDMKMPGIDGIGLLEILEKEYPDIPVIVLSGYQDFIYTRQAIKAQVVEYLPKPVDEMELNESLEKANLKKREREQRQMGYQLFTVTRPDIEAFIQPFQRTVSFSLKELNASQFCESIHQFLKKIDKQLKRDPSVLFHLHQEFLRILEEAIKEHKLNAEDIRLDLKKLSYQQNRTIEEELMQQLEIGQEVILKIEEINKQKTKINLEDIKQYINAHYASGNISLEVIAKKYFVSKEYLTTAFKKRFGCNITEYIISLRMEKAKELVVTTTLQYKTISEMIGYDDVSYFYRVFKKFFGTSPGGMRKN